MRHLPKHITHRPFTCQNIEKLNEALKNYDWSNVFDTDDPCQAYDKFLETYTMYLDKHILLKTVNFKRHKHKIEN